MAFCIVFPKPFFPSSISLIYNEAPEAINWKPLRSTFLWYFVVSAVNETLNFKRLNKGCLVLLSCGNAFVFIINTM